VSSRARPFGGDDVADHGAVHHVGQASLQAAHGFVRGLTGGALPVAVGPAFGGSGAQLDGGHDVQDLVDVPVPAAGQSLAHVVPGGRIDRGGAGPGGEVALVGKAGDVTDLDEQARGARRADAVQGE